MSITNFLPEDDQEYLASKGIEYELRSETVPGGAVRRAVLFPAFGFEGRLHRVAGAELVSASECELLVLIPPGYATAKLDSFFTFPRLKLADGSDPDRATGNETLFERSRQFWSRHLDDSEWRQGIDGIETYLRYVRAALRAA